MGSRLCLHLDIRGVVVCCHGLRFVFKVCVWMINAPKDDLSAGSLCVDDGSMVKVKCAAIALPS